MSKTQVRVNYFPTGYYTVANPEHIQITTPEGREISAETAAKAFDELRQLALDFRPTSGRMNGTANEQIRERFRQCGAMIDTHRRERDEARAERDDAKEMGRRFAAQRDEALAECRRWQVTGHPARTFTLRDAVELIAAELNVRELITAREKAGHVTEDTPVTLGMLEGIVRRAGDRERNGYSVGADALLQAVAEKLGGIH